MKFVTTGTFTQARANLRYTALIELNQKAVVDVMYSDNNIKLYKGVCGYLRLMAQKCYCLNMTVLSNNLEKLLIAMTILMFKELMLMA